MSIVDSHPSLSPYLRSIRTDAESESSCLRALRSAKGGEFKARGRASPRCATHPRARPLDGRVIARDAFPWQPKISRVRQQWGEPRGNKVGKVSFPCLRAANWNVDDDLFEFSLRFVASRPIKRVDVTLSTLIRRWIGKRFGESLDKWQNYDDSLLVESEKRWLGDFLLCFGSCFTGEKGDGTDARGPAPGRLELCKFHASPINRTHRNGNS
jgi:hypothetical protein